MKTSSTRAWIAAGFTSLGCTDAQWATRDAATEASTAPFLAALESCPDAAPLPPPASAPTPALVGTWRQCSLDLQLRADGTWERTSLRDRCTSRGRWRSSGQRLDLLVDGSTCARAPAELRDAFVTVTHDRLVIVHDALGSPGYTTYLSGALPHTSWRITRQMGTDPERVTILRVVGSPDSNAVSGCYWSGDGQCNGVFSCGGTVTQWRFTGGVLNAGLACTGDCTCGASLNGRVSDDRMDVRVTAHHCQDVWQGQVTGTRIRDEEL